MDLQLENKVIFIAGASQGIGFATAKRFLEENAKVVITGRNEAALEKAEKELLMIGTRAYVLAIPGDMTCKEDIQRALKKTQDHFGRLDSVVANIGSGKWTAGMEVPDAEWTLAMQGNFFGAMELSQRVLPYFLEQGVGGARSITFISSIVASESLNAPLPYSAAKAALHNAVKNLSRLVGSQGVRVNSVAPGNVLFSGGRWEEKLQERPEFFKQYIETEVPLQRFGKPEEIADAVVFLTSARAAFITGACLVVDGGQTRGLC